MSDKPDLSVVIPAYNEEKSIASTLADVRSALDGAGISHEIVVVDDGSSDGTVQAARDCGVPCRVLEQETNRGYGASLKVGVRHSSADVVVITDADGTYPNEKIPEMYRHLVDKGCDMVVGARTGEKVHVPLLRRPAKWCLTRLAVFLSRRPIPDLNSGLRVFSKELFRRFEAFFPSGFSLTSTITIAALVNDYSVHFQPINYHPREGKSKIQPIRDTMRFVRTIVSTVMYFAPLRIFFPIIAAFFLATVASLAYDLYLLNLNERTLVLGGVFAVLLTIGLLADIIDKRLPQS